MRTVRLPLLLLLLLPDLVAAVLAGNFGSAENAFTPTAASDAHVRQASPLLWFLGMLKFVEVNP